MYYDVYIDAVFVTNLIMDFLILRLLTGCLKYHTSYLRCLAGAVIGATGSCLILIIPTEYPTPVTYLLHGILATVMVKIGCKVHRKSRLLGAVVMLYFIGFLMGGFWDVLTCEGSVTLKTFFLFTAITYGVLSFAAWCRDYYQMRTKNLFQVHVSYQGKVLKTKGYYDTGNLLTDPGSGKAVSILSVAGARQLLAEGLIAQMQSVSFGEEEQNRGDWEKLKPHFLSFQSVGNSSGMILAITLDELCIHGEHQMIWIHQPVMAIPSEEFQLVKDCQIILNANLMEQ